MSGSNDDIKGVCRSRCGKIVSLSIYMKADVGISFLPFKPSFHLLASPKNPKRPSKGRSPDLCVENRNRFSILFLPYFESFPYATCVQWFSSFRSTYSCGDSSGLSPDSLLSVNSTFVSGLVSICSIIFYFKYNILCGGYIPIIKVLIKNCNKK